MTGSSGGRHWPRSAWIGQSRMQGCIARHLRGGHDLSRAAPCACKTITRPTCAHRTGTSHGGCGHSARGQQDHHRGIRARCPGHRGRQPTFADGSTRAAADCRLVGTCTPARSVGGTTPVCTVAGLGCERGPLTAPQPPPRKGSQQAGHAAEHNGQIHNYYDVMELIILY